MHATPGVPPPGGLGGRDEAGTQLGVVFMVVETGKFYVQPGSDEDIVYLGDEPVLAPTELRPGDRIKAGKYELGLLRQGRE